MREFLKFIIIKVFFTGVRKFLTMAAIAYALYSVSEVPQVREFAERKGFSKEEVISTIKESINDRLPSSLDKLRFKTQDRSKTEISKKEKDFFEQSGRSEDNGIDTTVNELVKELSTKRDKSDKSRGFTNSSDAVLDETIADSEKPLESDLIEEAGCIGAACSKIEEISSEGEVDEVSEVSEVDQDVVETTQSIMSCSSDKSEGLYGSNVLLNLSCSETANLTYCVQTGGTCCDPYNTPVAYSGTLDLNAGDGQYCVSFYGVSNDGVTSSVVNLTYTIDSTLPAIIVDFPRVQSQSTELPITNQTQSSDFGKPNHFYTQLNLKSHDPTATGSNWSCEDIKNMYAALTSPVASVIQPELATEGLLVSDQIDQSVGASDLDVGDNYIVTLFEDRTRNIISCQVQNVILEDTFNAAFTGTGSTPVFTGVRKTAGGFVGFGHYQTVPNSSTSGENENQQSLTVNKSDLFNIIY